MDEFQDLLTQSGQVLKAKTFNRCLILLVGLGGPTLLSKTNTVGPTPPVTIGGCLVKLVNKSRLLGVTVDDRLTWSPHLSEVKKSFANKLNLLRKSKFLPKSVLEQFYLSIILPSITYGLVIWANGSNELFRSIDKLHG